MVETAIDEGWVDNRGVKLHYIQSNRDTTPALIPTLYVHGAYGTAEGFLPEMEALSPRRCISISLRGRGKSDAPETDYSFDHHVSDIAVLVKHLALGRFCLMGWSVGVPWSVGYASRHPEALAGLILLDYPARYPYFSTEWADRALSNSAFPDWKPHVVRGIQRESVELPLWNELGKIHCPVLVIGGGQPGALLKPEHAENYRKQLPHVEIIVFNDSSHNVSKPDYHRFIRTLKEFLERIDSVEIQRTA